jgi:hypothetical protein
MRTGWTNPNFEDIKNTCFHNPLFRKCQAGAKEPQGAKAHPHRAVRPIICILNAATNTGSLAEFVGKRAVEKVASWKSPKAGPSHSTWTSRQGGAISWL